MSEIFKTFKSGEKKITPAVTHKEWLITVAETASLGVNYLKGTSYNYKVSGDIEHQFNIQDSKHNEGTTSSGSAASTTGNGYVYYEKLVHDNINHLYYGDGDDPVSSFCNDAPHLLEKSLGAYVSVVSIPSAIYGEKIKPGTFVYSQSEYVATDDGKGNLVDLLDTTGSIAKVANSSSILYLGLDDGFKYTAVNTTSKTIATSSTFIESPNHYIARGHNVKYTQDVGEILGESAIIFHGSHSLQETNSIDNPSNNSYVRIENSKGLDLGSDWAISLWARIPLSQSISESYAGGWDYSTGNNSRITRKIKPMHTNVILTSRNWSGGNCPFEIAVCNDLSSTDGKIKATLKSKTLGLTKTLISTAKVNDGGWHHISLGCKAGTIRLGIDGAVVTTVTGYDQDQLNSAAPVDIHLGARPYNYRQRYYNTRVNKWYNQKDQRNFISPFSGSVANLRIYDEDIMSNATLLKNVSASIDQTNTIGNIFYEHGIATITTLNGMDGTSYTASFGDLASSVEFKGTHAIKEHLYICNILDGEYNATYNPTARDKFDTRNDNLQAYTTHSDFNPYVTTIGLYNEYHELVAVGKLAQPIKNQDDYDNTFQIRFDTTI